MDKRRQALYLWLLTTQASSTFEMQVMPGDASTRRYFRIIDETKRTYVAMDAPPITENCRPFIEIANALRKKGLTTPVILASDVPQGFLLLTDFGKTLFRDALTPENADVLYGQALNVLAILRTCEQVDNWKIPPFTEAIMRQEIELFKSWFLKLHYQVTLSPSVESLFAETFDFIFKIIAEIPIVFMHRDYHSANIMVLPNHRLGLLDFQDAFMGPATYDLVSILRDCYVSWPDEKVMEWALYYKNLVPELYRVTDQTFLLWFDMMGLQRHMKALMTFARKYHRDGNVNYLQHIPRVLGYIKTVSERYEECKGLSQFFNNEILSKQVYQCVG